MKKTGLFPVKCCEACLMASRKKEGADGQI